MSFAMRPLRRALALSAATTLVATAATVALTAAAPSAQAQSGRRLCMYVNGERTRDHNTRFIVVNYKKDGACPPIDREKYPTLISYANPVPKATCEEISAAVEFESKYYRDLCYLLYADTVYGLFKRDGQPLHALGDITNYGPVWNLD